MITNAKVSKLVDGECNWNWKLLNKRLPDELLSRIVGSLPFCDVVGFDSIIKLEEMNKNYTIGGMCRVIVGQKHVHGDSNWMKIWKLQALRELDASRGFHVMMICLLTGRRTAWESGVHCAPFVRIWRKILFMCLRIVLRFCLFCCPLSTLI